MSKALKSWVLSVVLIFPLGAFATDLSGKIILSKSFFQKLEEAQKAAEKNTARGYWNQPNGVRPVELPRVDFTSSFGVALFRDGAEKTKPDPVKSVDVLTGGLSQQVVVIRPESRVKFIMKSPFDHELYSPHKHDFKPQAQGVNTMRPVDFYTAGVFEVLCKRFPHFQGWIVVTPATSVPALNNRGEFEAKGLEEGKYTLKVFFGGHWVALKKFEVSGRKQEVSVVLKDVASLDKQDKKGEKKDSLEPAPAAAAKKKE